MFAICQLLHKKCGARLPGRLPTQYEKIISDRNPKYFSSCRVRFSLVLRTQANKLNDSHAVGCGTTRRSGKNYSHRKCLTGFRQISIINVKVMYRPVSFRAQTSLPLHPYYFISYRKIFTSHFRHFFFLKHHRRPQHPSTILCIQPPAKTIATISGLKPSAKTLIQQVF